MVKPIARIQVTPNLPDSLRRLHELAYNLRWAWDHESIALFRRIDPKLWGETNHNPVLVLGKTSQERFAELSQDPAFLAHLERVCISFDEYMSAKNTWYDGAYGETQQKPIIAYFSMEFGVAECLQNYSGGLGVLSGDHLKSASDLNIPLIGVGLLYTEGYFKQYLNVDGYQQEQYPINDYANMPVILQRNADGSPIKINVPLPGRDLYAICWKVQIGRVPLFLLDTNTPENTREDDRSLTNRLYGGDRHTRIRQEILMGVGGIRLLEALNLRPTICHMNEGHSAFLALERIRQVMSEEKLSFNQAKEITAASNIFTTHTSVPAGLEQFSYDVLGQNFGEYLKALGISWEDLLNLGREHTENGDVFSMPVLALNLSAGANGVAKLHGDVSRKLWQWLYPNIPEAEVPVGSITNGVHTQTWMSREMGVLLDRYLDPSWRTEESRPDVWSKIDTVPDAELWRTHERRRERLVQFIRNRLRKQLEGRSASQAELKGIEEALNPDALTIGFARRFATYKRATLLFSDIERLSAIINNTDRPVQIIYAGKAHPHDVPGKEFIRQIAKYTRHPDFYDRIVFIENYDMNVARYLIQGVDIWLNNPQRPKEASGTSGMKVIYNGGLNCSVLDGWWEEGYSPEVGWAIGSGEDYVESQGKLQDEIESQALYNILEKDIVPLFYQRGRDGLPREWIGRIKESMKRLAPYFNTRRMVQEYTTQYYMPNYQTSQAMRKDHLKGGLAFAAWREKLEKQWRSVQVRSVQLPDQQIKTGVEVEVNAWVALGELAPKDVSVQLYYGGLTTRGEIGGVADTLEMTPVGKSDHGTHHYTCKLVYQTSGERGVSVRVVPKHEYLHSPFAPRLIAWA